MSHFLSHKQKEIAFQETNTVCELYELFLVLTLTVTTFILFIVGNLIYFSMFLLRSWALGVWTRLILNLLPNLFLLWPAFGPIEVSLEWLYCKSDAKCLKIILYTRMYKILNKIMYTLKFYSDSNNQMVVSDWIFPILANYNSEGNYLQKYFNLRPLKPVSKHQCIFLLMKFEVSSILKHSR